MVFIPNDSYDVSHYKEIMVDSVGLWLWPKITWYSILSPETTSPFLCVFVFHWRNRSIYWAVIRLYDTPYNLIENANDMISLIDEVFSSWIHLLKLTNWASQTLHRFRTRSRLCQFIDSLKYGNLNELFNSVERTVHTKITEHWRVAKFIHGIVSYSQCLWSIDIAL